LNQIVKTITNFKDVMMSENENEGFDMSRQYSRTEFQDRHILIIGGAGYIGSVLTRMLLSKGYSVRCLDKLIYGNGKPISDLMEIKEFSFVYGDFGEDEILEKALSNITDVVLLAALVGDPICKKYPDLAKKTNEEYPKNLVQKLIGRNISRLIFTSTCSNYGLRTSDTPADEESDLNPQSLYAVTKIATEKFILENLDKLDYSPTILRLSTAFGISARMRFDLTISEFTKELAFGKDLIVFDENTWRPYCNVSDISDAIIKVLESPKEKVFGQVFNVGSNNNNYTKRMILDLIGKHIDTGRIEYKKGGFDPRNYRVSFNKIKEILDFDAQVSAEDSIIKLANAIKNNLFADADTQKNLYGNYEILNQ
jgi:nucleoside-diphosphate-sugar epimerase